MRPVTALLLFGLSVLCSGCALIEDSCRNFCVAACCPFETHQELARNRLWAENAWAKACTTGGPRGFSEDYAQGFKDGYAEYLYRGGDGEPPLLAPKRYRHVQYQTPQGYMAVEEWFAGYRHGTAVARDTGARRWITGPTGWLPDPHGAPAHRPATSIDPPPTLPMPQILEKTAFEQRMPEGTPAANDLPAYPHVGFEGPPPAEPTRAKIMGISVPPLEEPEAPQPKAIIKGISVPTPEPEPKATIKGITVPTPEPEPKAMIRGITVQPPVESAAAVEPVRARIRMVTPAPPKE
jgi:hypothetical protein